MPIEPKHLDQLGLMRDRVRQDRFTVLQVPGMYRAVAGAVGDWLVDTELGLGTGAPAAFLGTIGQTAAINGVNIHGRHSVLFTATNCNATLTFTITGINLHGNQVSEVMALTTTGASSQSKPTVNIYKRITSIILNSGVPDPAGTLGIGHGVSTVATATGSQRYPISAKATTQAEIRAILDPNGLPITPVAWDFVRHVAVAAVGPTFAAGEYVVHYNDNFSHVL